MDKVVKPLVKRKAETSAASSGHCASKPLSSGAPAASGEPGPEPVTPGAPKKAKKALFNVQHYSRQQATAWLPKVTGTTIQPVNNRTWCVRYGTRAVTPRSHTVTYEDAEGSYTQHTRALVQCLEWAWNVHHNEMGGEACPHTFDLHAET